MTDLLRRRWRRLLVGALVLYVTGPWVAMDSGMAAVGLRNPYVQLIKLDDLGAEGFKMCSRDSYCVYPEVVRWPWETPPPRSSPPPALRYVPPGVRRP